VEKLCLLPGVGEAVAAEIIAYRNRRKGFSSVDELKKIKGLGEKRFPFIKPYVTVVRLSSLPEEEQEEEKAE
jgi:competence protein ComEA